MASYTLSSNNEIIVSGAVIGHPAWLYGELIVVPLIAYSPENFPHIVVSSGMRYVDTTVNYSGILTVSSFGKAENTTIAIRGTMFVSSGGTATGNTIQKAGVLHVSSGGTATNTNVSSGGSLCVSSGGMVNSTTVTSGGSMLVCEGGMATGNTIHRAGVLHVSSDGTANNNNIVGELHVSSGGTATGNTIRRAGVLHVSSGGTATDITASAQARLFLTLAPDTYIAGTSDGSAFVLNGKSLSDYTVAWGGELYVASGCTATNIDCAPWEGHVFIEEGATVTFASSYSGVYYYPAGYGEIISSAMSMESVTIEPWAEINVMSGGVLNSVTVSAGGGLYVSSGGTAANANVFADARLMITSGGTANNTRIECIGHVVVSGGTTTNNQINGGILSVFCGGLADSTTIAGGNETHPGYIILDITKGVLDVCSGGTATNTTVTKDGRMTVYAGGTADSVAVETGGIISVSSGGTATILTLADGVAYDFTAAPETYIAGTSGGSAFEISNGMVSDYTVNDRGTLHLSSDGTATNITISSGGSIIVHAGGAAVNNMLSADGIMAVFSGGSVTGTTINSDGAIIVYDGGTATLTSIDSGGKMTVFSGGIANSTTVNDGGELLVSVGVQAKPGSAVADGATVNSGGRLDVFSGAKLTGTMTFGNGAVVSMQENAILDFDISEAASGSPARVSDLSLVQGTPVYTLTISASQPDGVYTLAGGAAGFDNPITVYNASGNELGTVSAGGILLSGGKSYALNLSSGTLSLTAGSGILADVIASNPAELTIAGNETFSAAVYLNGIQSVVVENGTFSKQLYGGGVVSGSATAVTTFGNAGSGNAIHTDLTINGGIFNENVYGGDKLNLGFFNHYGDISLTINGGTFHGVIAGGIRHNKSDISKPTFAMHDGDVNLTITSGHFIKTSGHVNSGWIFGGTYATKKANSGLTLITGNVTTTISVAAGDTVQIDGTVVAGSYGSGAIGGNVRLVLSGAGTIEVGEKLWGACDGDYYPADKSQPFQTVIGGDRILSFSGFTGTLDCPRIRAFKSIEFVKNGEVATSVSLTENYNLTDIENWTFENGCEANASFTTDFSGDTLNLKGFNSMSIGDSRNLLTDTDNTDAGNVFSGFESVNAVTMDGAAVSSKSFADNTWSFSANGEDYRLSLETSGAVTSMTITRIA